MLPREGDGEGWRVGLLAESVAQGLGIFCTESLSSAGVVTALSDQMVGGPFPAQLTSA